MSTSDRVTLVIGFLSIVAMLGLGIWLDRGAGQAAAEERREIRANIDALRASVTDMHVDLAQRVTRIEALRETDKGDD